MKIQNIPEILSPCCGYGGLTAYANKDMAAKMTEKVSGTFRCTIYYILHGMQRPIFAREGRESRHILELLYGANASNMPDISEETLQQAHIETNTFKKHLE